MPPDDATQDDEDECCMLCLEPLPVESWRGTERTMYVCCGREFCTPCVRAQDATACELRAEIAVMIMSSLSHRGLDERRQALHALEICPACRGKRPDGLRGIFEQLQQHAVTHNWAWVNFQLGYSYYKGLGTAIDENKAYQYLRKAAEQGMDRAYYAVAECCFFGRGVPQCRDTAIVWYRKGAERGDMQCQCGLADELINHHGDIAEGIRFARLSAHQGYPKAQLLLGSCYYNGLPGLPKSYAQALHWNTLAAQAGEAMGMVFCAALLMQPPETTMTTTRILGRAEYPQAIYWARLAQASTDKPEFRDLAVSCLAAAEDVVKAGCACCQRRFGTPPAAYGRLLRCARCQACYYCGRDCQKHDWKTKHKWECVHHADGSKNMRPSTTIRASS